MKNSPTSSRPRAFTLLETIVTMVVLAIIMAVASRLFLSAAQGYTSAAARGELHTELSCAMDRIVMELRGAGVKAGTTPAAADIVSTTASSVSWVGADGIERALSKSGTTVVYAENGATGETLASGITTFGIATFDDSNTALAASLSGTDTENIQRVQVTLVATRGGVTETIRTRVFLRARMATGS